MRPTSAIHGESFSLVDSLGLRAGVLESGDYVCGARFADADLRARPTGAARATAHAGRRAPASDPSVVGAAIRELTAVQRTREQEAGTKGLPARARRVADRRPLPGTSGQPAHRRFAAQQRRRPDCFGARVSREGAKLVEFRHAGRSRQAHASRSATSAIGRRAPRVHRYVLAGAVRTSDRNQSVGARFGVVVGHFGCEPREV